MLATTNLPEDLLEPLDATVCRRAVIDRAGHIAAIAPRPRLNHRPPSPPRITGEVLDEHRRQASRLRADMLRAGWAWLGRVLRGVVSARR